MNADTHDSAIPPSYAFRLRSRIPHDRALNCEETMIALSTGDSEHTLELTGEDKKQSIASARWLVLTGRPYISHEEAWEAGVRARNALMECSIRTAFPVDLGKDKATGGFSKYVKDKMQAKFDVQIENDVHGLLVYDESRSTKFARAHASATVVSSAQRILKAFEEAYATGHILTDKQQVAFELLASTGFELSPRSRFLALVMAIEALLEPAPREDAALEHVQSLLLQTRDSILTPEERDSLEGSLRWLLKESITKTGKKLATHLLGKNEYAGKDPASFFAHCYTLRSELVHSGRTNAESTDISAINADLRRFVADLLLASIRANKR